MYFSRSSSSMFLLEYFCRDTLAKLQDGRLPILSVDWVAFLYDQALYDPEDLEKGLLKGYLLLRVRSRPKINISSFHSPSHRFSCIYSLVLFRR